MTTATLARRGPTAAGIPDVDVVTRYPVVVEATSTYIVWVEADNPTSAAARVKDAPEEWIDGEQPVDGDITSRAVDAADWYRELEPIQGPVIACPDCLAPASEPGTRVISHRPSCGRHVHYVHVQGYGDPYSIRPAGWIVTCSCTPGRRARPGAPWVVPPVAGPFPDRDATAAAAREHVATRFHARHLPLGITTDCYPGRRFA